MYATEFATNFVSITCATCGLVFWTPADWEQSRREKHDTFYCPNGHSNYFPSKTAQERDLEEKTAEVDRLRKQIAWKEGMLKNANKHNVVLKGQLTKTKNKAAQALRRHAAGVCPCCRRTFSQLVRHMSTKHPDYKPTTTCPRT